MDSYSVYLKPSDLLPATGVQKYKLFLMFVEENYNYAGFIQQILDKIILKITISSSYNSARIYQSLTT
jgi:hypothetical protein